MKKIYIYGASGHGLVVADIARACGYEKIIYIDDGENTYPSFDDIKEENHIPLAFGIGVNATRKKLFLNVIEYGFDVVNLVHPSAILSSTVTFGMGTVVMPNVVVNTHSNIGDGVILNTSCVIEHENIIGNFVHISPNVALAGEVTIKENTHIGIGSNIIQGITVGKNCIIGAGSVVIRNIENSKLCFGNPCKVIKDLI
jgi:UDP-N-acetylbacillosamine N-acetyltransferase